MPAKQRQAKVRRQCSDADVIEIFRMLESMSPRRRKAAPFLDEDFRLYSERRCSICSVFDREAAPPWPADMPAAKDWHKVRGVRLELLAALKETAPAG
jgi:hypothetical protein